MNGRRCNPERDISTDSDLDSIASDLERRISQGEQVDVAFYMEKYPSVDPQRIRDTERAVRAMLAAWPDSARDSDSTPTAGSTTRDERDFVSPALAAKKMTNAGTLFRFGNYELLEMVGRGGMGIVYRARHLPTGRIAAVKMIRSERLMTFDSDTRERELSRFRTEIEAAAQLEHDHIVTVYEVGQIDGNPYYAMQYVEGPTLAKIVQDGPIESRRAAAYMEPIAHAVAACHGVSVLHRDMKPSNILVQSAGDRPLLADFGLAKLAAADAQLTGSGAQIGTPAYMSPEQAKDSSKVTESSDVYGLGATLYHLITGRPPFQAPTPGEILPQVIENDPVRPRRLNPEVDRDLETICLKCLEKDQQARYESATAMAEDLGRYLKREPIKGRPIGPIGRIAKWARRKPAIAALGTLLSVSVIGGFAGITVQYYRAEAARKTAQSNLATAVAAMDFIGDELGTQLADVPRMEKLRRSVLERAIEFNKSLLKDNPDDRDVQVENGRANTRLGKLYEAVGDYNAGEDAYRTAESLFESANRVTPSDKAIWIHLAEARSNLVEVLRLQGRYNEAESYVGEINDCLAELRERLKDYDKNTEYMALQSTILAHEAEFLTEKSPAEAETKYREAIDIHHEILNVSNANQDAVQLASRYKRLGVHLRHTKRFDEGQDAYQNAIDLLKDVHSRNPQDVGLELSLGDAWHDLGVCCRIASEFDKAQEAYREAERIFAKLVGDFPNGATYRAKYLSNRAETYHGLAMIIESSEDALAYIQKAIDEQRKAKAMAPDDVTFRHQLRNKISMLAIIQHDLQDHVAAAATIDEFLSLTDEAFDYLCPFGKGVAW